MIVMACSNITFSFGSDLILDNAGFNIRSGEKAGLVGVNGAGKTTLFKIIIRDLQPDSGDVFVAKGRKIGYLDQNAGLDSNNTIWDELLSAYSGLIRMEERIKLLEKRISAEKNAEALSSLMKEYSMLTEKFTREGGYEYNSRVRGVLRGLGFSDSEFTLKIRSLSGGQKTRLALAKLLLEEPDILMLDEPTNHLDMGALEWLEDYLKSYGKCLLVISHDRYFLDAVADKIIELENGACTAYNGNYSEYVRQKAVARTVQQKHFEQQQAEISRMEAFIEQQRRWNREKNIVAAESRQKAIDRMKKIQAPGRTPGKIKLKFESGIVSGNDVLFVENLSKEFPGKPLFNNICFELKRNEKIFLLGPNGCGKTTLLKILAGRTEKSGGNFEYGHKIIIGYYDQELEDLDESNTVLEEVWEVNTDLTHTHIRNALAQFLFTGEDVFKPVNKLSGGEKSRVALLKLVLSGANVLILDEPTNHLDINSREALEEALVSFDGTIFAVSHDRYFINKLAGRVMEMADCKITDYRGGYTYYLDHRRTTTETGTDGEPGSPISSSKLEHLESKEERARKRKHDKQLGDTETEIGKIEKRLHEIENEMSADYARSDHVVLTELLNEQETLQTRLNELYELWAELTE